MQHAAIKTISTSAIADILVDADIEQTLDTGTTIVTTLVHAKLGHMTVITNALDELGVVMLSEDTASLLPH